MPMLASGGGAYSTDHRMTTCGDGVRGEELLFGFTATGLRLHNTCTDPLYYTLTTEVATTKCAFVAGCSALQIEGSMFTPGISLLTTSTSTGAGLPAARPRISVSAWGN